VGDFDSKQLVEESQVTSDWQKGEIAKVKPPEVMKPKEFTPTHSKMPDAAQLHLYLGHVGIRRNDPDFLQTVGDGLHPGTGPGFTDRLSSKIRDRAGLAYTVAGNITSSASEEPGIFNCYIGTAPGNFEKVKKMILTRSN